MQLRQLGRSDLHVAPIALGTNVFGWTVSQAEAFHLLDAFVDAGLNLIDTADIYSNWIPGNAGGESETAIGAWIAKNPGKRSKIVLATKVGMALRPDAKGLSKRWIVQAVEDSLRRLNTDQIDLYQAHQDDTETPLEETLAAFTTLVRDGKVGYIGASNYNGKRLDAAMQLSRGHDFAEFVSLQPHYNLYDREPFESDLRPVCASHGIGVISYFSLASGFLTGKYRQVADVAGRPRGDGLKDYFTPRGERILNALNTVSQECGAKPASVALAWLIAQPTLTAAIASATSLVQLQDLVQATSLELSHDQIGLLSSASADIES